MMTKSFCVLFTDLFCYQISKENIFLAKQMFNGSASSKSTGRQLKPGEQLYTPKQVYTRFGITPRTLYQWGYEGKIEYIWSKGGHRRYILRNGELSSSKRRNICYCRVSSQNQRDDLKRQQEFFRLEYPQHEIVSDIGSGINFKRKNFRALLESILSGEIESIVVTHRDRLLRFGFPLIEQICKSKNTKILCVNSEKQTSEQELISDLVSIITVFTSRVHGRRSHSVKKKIQEIKTELQSPSLQEETPGQIIQDDNIQDIPIRE